MYESCIEVPISPSSGMFACVGVLCVWVCFSVCAEVGGGDGVNIKALPTLVGPTNTIKQERQLRDNQWPLGKTESQTI